MAEQHPPSTAEQAAGDLESLSSRLEAKRGRHLLFEDFNT